MDVPDAGVFFTGYGVTDSEYKWDDYSGIDVHGKIVAILNGDPPVADPNDPSKLDDKMFAGRVLTYYGRTGTKLDNAYAHGAVAVILIAATRPTGPNLFLNYSRENMILRDSHDRSRVKAQALLLPDKAKELFAAASQDFDVLRASAAKPGFRAVPLGISASFQISNQVRKIDSANVLAKISGSDPRLKSEYVIYSGHWDHHSEFDGKIFHGASDNAAGTAGVLELSRVFRSLHPTPRRTILFLWTTRKGLQWRLISHLSLNYLSLVEEGRGALQDMLRLYSFTESPAVERQISGISALSCRRHFARVVSEHGISFARGVRVEMQFDEDQFAGSGVYLFASILELFLGLYTSLNSFSQLVVRSKQRKEILREWRPRAGQKILL